MRPTAERLFLPLALAAAVCALNALKPLTVDDPAYWYVARQLVADPSDPYGFKLLWYDVPQPAKDILLPPALPYWLSLGMRLFGENVFLIKLWLFPFCAALMLATDALARRFARGQEWVVLALTAFSPVLLPGLNLMLDVPALALGLAALAVFFRACDMLPGGSWRAGGVSPSSLFVSSKPLENLDLACSGLRALAVAALLTLVAGLLAGLAIQTKYSGAVFPALIVVAAVTHRRWPLAVPLAVLAGVVASAVFLGWELYSHVKYGESHFLHHYEESKKPASNRGPHLLVLPLFAMLGGLAFPLALLVMSAVRRGWVVALAAAGVFTAGLLAVAWLPDGLRVWLTEVVRDDDGDLVARARLTVESAHDGLSGIVVTGVVLAATMWLLLRRARGRRPWRSSLPAREDVFLAVWLAGEVLAYFALSPFPAARRLTGLVAVLTLLTGRFAAVSWRTTELLGDCSPWPDVRAAAWRSRVTVPYARAGVVAFGVALGLLYFAVDWRDAEVERVGAVEAVTLAREKASPDGRVWYVGHWGFQFYAERAGARPVVPDESQFLAGDTIVEPESRIYQQDVEWKTAPRRAVHEFEYADPLPYRTVWVYYAGRTPLERCRGPRLTVTVYRVRADFPALMPRPED